MSRDHSCETCGRGGFNDPDGRCICDEGVGGAIGTAVVEEAGATCRVCDWFFLGEAAVDQAGAHHDTTGHATLASEKVTVRYGEEPHDGR